MAKANIGVIGVGTIGKSHLKGYAAVELPEWTGGNLWTNFVDACLTNALPKTPGEDGMKAMQISDAAYTSAKEGREIWI